MQRALKPVCAVHHGGFIQAFINARDGRQIDDGIPARALPQRKPFHKIPYGVLIRQKRIVGVEKLVIEAFRGENAEAQGIYDDPTDEVGNRDDGLNAIFPVPVPNLVEQNGQKHGKPKTGHPGRSARRC